MRRADLLKSYGFKFFDKVPSGYPYAGCVRYKKIMGTSHMPFLSAVIGATWVLMGYTAQGEIHERLVHTDDEIEDFILEYNN